MLRLGRFARFAPALTAILLLAACARSYPPAPVDYRAAQGHSRPTTSAPSVATRSQPAPVQMAAATVARPQTHRVQKGETIYTVARRYGVENNALVRTNNLPPPYRLEPGQVLNIPGGAPQSPPATIEAATPPAATTTQNTAPAAIPTDGVRRGGIDSAPLAAPGRTSAAPVAAPEAPPVQVANATGASSLAPIVPGSSKASPEPRVVEPVNPVAPIAAAPEPIKVPARPASPVIDAAASSSASTAGRSLVDPDVAMPSRGGRSFQWPLRGQIVSEFGAKSGGLHNDGINIAATQGATVRASEAGVVVYAGNEVRGFGNLLLIRHADGWMTAYAHVDEMLVRRDEQVRRGQTIAKVGRTGNVTTPQLHFEIRRGTRSVNPREFLQPETASLD
jgi:murein DD-endopeptidase MepM/ murein hydrolase activator NlpD